MASNLSAYEKRIAADPNYKASRSGDMVGWIVQNYGKEWLKPDGTAPDEAIWTYTGGENGEPRIGSVTGINYLPWNDKNNQYDVNGQDYSRPQYDNGPGLPSGGYKGTEAEIQADRDANNYYRNGGKGMNPAMLASLANVNQQGGLKGLQRDSYTLPDGSVYNVGRGVTKADPWGVNASFNGPGGSWNENHWGKQMQNGVYKGFYPGQSTMEALGLNGFSPTRNSSNGVRPGQFIGRPPGGGNQGGGQGGGQPPAPPIPGAVPAGPSPYVSMPANQQGRFAAGQPGQAPRGPWMQQQNNADAMAAQIAQAAALRGGNG